ncbi:MAG: histidine kinase [Saprospiraceae bacterium]|nr:histidine kinase [Saprospiraceae bacterium]
MNISIDKKRVRLFAQIGLAFLVLSWLSDLTSHADTFPGHAANSLWRAVYIVAANFVLFEYTLPYLSRKRIFRSLLALGALFLVFTFGFFAWRQIGIELHLWSVYDSYERLLDGVCDQFKANIPTVFFFGIVRHLYDFTQLRQLAQQLRIEKQEAELNFLKSQTNPHFLFNTLNNIYALAKDKSEQAPESILRLSQILRYMLYETSGAYIPIEQEIKVISDYIALEQLRYDDTLRVSYKNDIEDMKQALPPLLLIPLVENAFKHGVSETRNQPFVDIFLSVKQRQLRLVVKNSTDESPDERPVKENIGLSNLRRQLELLYTDYQLSVQQGESEFTATLHINLASHV